MNLREVKKDIEYVLGAFIEDCSAVVSVNPKASDEKIAALMEEAIDLYNELKDKVNAKVEGNKRTYFAELRKEILVKSNGLYERLSECVKESMK